MAAQQSIAAQPKSTAAVYTKHQSRAVVCHPCLQGQCRSSPMNIIAGWFSCATLKSILTSFSPSPCHLLVKVAAEMLKKVALASWANAFASMVLPLPGGPYRSSPRAGALKPWKRSALCVGKMTISCRACADKMHACCWQQAATVQQYVVCKRWSAYKRCWQAALHAALAEPCCRWLQTARADMLV